MRYAICCFTYLLNNVFSKMCGDIFSMWCDRNVQQYNNLK